MMQIQLNLMGALKAKSPEGNRLEIEESATITQVLASLDISPEQVQIVMVNGKPQPNRETVTNDGDELTVIAPVGGG